MTTDKDRVLDLVRRAFRGVTLGNGVGLHQGQGLDDYADERTLVSLRARDEKNDWSAIPVADLDGYYSGVGQAVPDSSNTGQVTDRQAQPDLPCLRGIFAFLVEAKYTTLIPWRKKRAEHYWAGA